jgi:hypothetical protein
MTPSVVGAQQSGHLLLIIICVNPLVLKVALFREATKIASLPSIEPNHPVGAMIRMFGMSASALDELYGGWLTA